MKWRDGHPPPVLPSTAFFHQATEPPASNLLAALELEKTDNVPRHEIILRQNETSRDADHSVTLPLRGPIFGGPGSRASPDPAPPPHPERRLLPVRHQI